jgi:outer membrane immunogenic protein
MHHHLRSLFFALALFSIAQAACADGYEPVARAAPVALRISNWTGFYANGGVGYGLWDAQTTVVNPATGACVVCDRIDHGGRGWLGEVGVGYDVQVAPRFVLGAFFNYDFSDIKGTISDASLPAAGRSNNDSTWFVGARGGWLMTPDVLNYWGVGYTQARFGGAELTGCGACAAYSTPRFTLDGWFISGGLEVAMHDGWFWRSEVRYSDYSREAVREIGPVPFDINFDPVVETATTEIVYKFNWGR